MGPKPTLLVATGHGLHAWWLFREPWICEHLEVVDFIAAPSVTSGHDDDDVNEVLPWR